MGAYANKSGIRIVGAILIIVAVLFLLVDFIGYSFVAIGSSNGLSPVRAFTASFSANGSTALTVMLIIADVLVVAALVLCILTGIMALVNKKYFSPLWAAIAYGVLCIVFIVMAIVQNSSPAFGLNSLMGGAGVALTQVIGDAVPDLRDISSVGGMLTEELNSLIPQADIANALPQAAASGTVLPTLWMILGLACAIVPVFMLRKSEASGASVVSVTPLTPNTGSESVTVEIDPNDVTNEAEHPNMQGVEVRVKYTDGSGSHVVRRQILTDSPLTIGRSERCKLVLEDSHASSLHARLSFDDLNGMVIEDNASTNGVQVNGETIMKARRISEDDTVRIGDSKLVFTVVGNLDDMDGEVTQAAGDQYREPVRVKLNFNDDSGPRTENFWLKKTVMLGKMRECEVQIESNTVSHKHARLINLGNGRIAIEDNGSTNGVLVNGERIKTATPIGTGDVVTLGSVNVRVNVGR